MCIRFWPIHKSDCQSTSDHHATLIHCFFLFPFSAKCNAHCMKRRTEKKLRRTIRTLRKSMTSEKFYVRLDGHDYEVARKTPPAYPRPNRPQPDISGGGGGGGSGGSGGDSQEYPSEQEGVQGNCPLGSVHLNGQCGKPPCFVSHQLTVSCFVLRSILLFIFFGQWPHRRR